MKHFERVGSLKLDLAQITAMIEQAVNNYRIATEHEKSGAKLSLPKEEERQASNIRSAALRLGAALRKAKSEPMKRIVENMVANGVGADPAKLREGLRKEIPDALARLAQAATYAMERADRHKQQGDKPHLIKDLAVLLASIWIMATGQKFGTSRKNARQDSDAERIGAEFVRDVLHQIVLPKFRPMTDKGLRSVLRHAQKAVAKGPYWPSTASTRSTSGREFD